MKEKKDRKFQKTEKRKIVWQFTNQRKLTAPEFKDYFERKVFRTIRKYNLLPKDKKFKFKKSDKENLNAKVLKNILEKKFKTDFSEKSNISVLNMSETAEEIFKQILRGDFQTRKTEKLKPEKIKAPLYFLSEKEVELYAKLNSIKGKKQTQDQKIQKLFNEFRSKNPDLEHNIINAFSQLS